MIYGRFGGRVEVIRTATIEDVNLLDKRKPDQQDRDAIALGSYLLTRSLAPTPATFCRLHRLAYMRADGGSKEIAEAVALADTIHEAATRYADQQMAKQQ